MRNRGVFKKTHGSRQRLFWLCGGVLLAALVGFLVFNPLATKKKKHALGPPKTKEEAIERIQRDTDTDGLKDWEEKIYGTNPEKADTDNDGALDGEEIKLSRNPLRAGPDDTLSIPLPPPEDANKTDALVNEFIGRSLTQVIAESIAGGRSLDSSAVDTTSLQSYVAKLNEERLLDKVILPEDRDLTISSDNSPEAVKKYFNTVAKIHIAHFSSIDSDISVLYLAVQSNNPKAFRRLNANIAAIEKAIEETKRVPVPSKWLGFAKNYIRYLSQTLAAVKILSRSETDPVSSLLILNSRFQLIDDFQTLYRDTKIGLAAAGIVFDPNEPAFPMLKK